MGNNMTCPCSDSSAKEVVVLVIREDGNLLKFKKGVHAKEIMEANEGHKLVKCCSERTVMPGSAELESKRLYFLVQEAMAQSPEVYDKLWQLCVAKGLVEVKRSMNGSSRTSPNQSDHVCELRRSCAWTPQLKTIPEITSPQGNTPPRVEFYRLIREGSSEWQKLCRNETYVQQIPNMHVDPETILVAKVRPINVVSKKSFIGFFQLENFEKLQDFLDLSWALSFAFPSLSLSDDFLVRRKETKAYLFHLLWGFPCW
ncbi:hypothetical protein J5N97_017423 [Dioscorea zingiberensis]|uniref:Uncharacterized protein n=1 Tax=Dioscorea zingiberensis TaxID=325984 RepID=A0A9D5CN67_9LILI|nr:hypothetical protein J5N97_017423 [Dioscorea zingiberensis]